jgi:putative transcription antitermination factor YqgF
MADIIGLDIGSRHIGVARMNDVALLPEPLSAIDLKVDSDYMSQINAVCSYHHAVRLVIGVPMKDGKKTSEQAKHISDVIDSIKSYTSLPVDEVDEALSSLAAAQLTKIYPQASTDSLAACVILERFVSDNPPTLKYYA